MNRKIAFTVITLVFFSTWFDSAPVYASFNETSDGYSRSVVASSGTIWVPDNYTRIQWAIDNASAGDTIFVRAGAYYERIRIEKSLRLVGENRSSTVIDGNGTGIVVYVMANDVSLSGFTIQNGEFGIRVSRSSNNILAGNTASDNMCGIYFWWSTNNALNGNIVSNNDYGIYFLGSANNAFTGNVASNNQYGIYLDGSGYNTLSGNNVSSNDNSGILLYHSGSNVLSGNIASNNQYGIYLSDSDNNVLSGNVASNNQYGIYLYYSCDNILTGITATNSYYGIRLASSSNDNALTGNIVSSNHYGIRLTSSSNNIICHNNFIGNTEPASSVDSANSWARARDGAEGNYWSDYDGHDANLDGIGDTPYPIYENNRDNYPLMATYVQLTIAKNNQSHKIDAVSSSTISSLQHSYDPDNEIDAVGFKVNGTEGECFCRISIAHALIEPPYRVTVDQNSPLYFETVHTNGTHTWLYFTYDSLEHEVTIVQKLIPERLELSQWAILGLSLVTVILLLISARYYRMFKGHKKVIQAYERELGSFPVSHSERARLRFVKDLIERREKIEEFKKKYGIDIQPADTLEDLMEKLGVKKKVNR